jgi:ankyrin repeat protein
MKNTTLLLGLFFLALTSFGQKNPFLDRAYWRSNPSIQDIDQKIVEGHDISALNGNAFDAVSYALIEKTDNKIIRHLLSKKGNDVNKITHDGRTYIFWAAYKGNLEMMQYLLDRGAKTDIRDDNGNSALTFAAATGQVNTKLYDFFIQNGFNPKTEKNHSGANALLLVAPFIKDFTLIDYFTSKGIDIRSTDNNGNGIFNYAAKTGNIPLLKHLVAKELPHKELAKDGGNAMIFASRGTRNVTNKVEVYQYLESLGVNPNVVTKSGITPLHGIAGKVKDKKVYAYFLSKGVNINQTDDKGRTALTHALTRNSLDIVKFLIDHGADVHIKDKKGNNLTYHLIRSYRSNQFEAFQQKAKLLSQKGLNIAQHQQDGNSLYHLALETNDLTLLEWVRKSKVDVNFKNQEGLTALHKAAMTAKDDQILKYLLRIGADKTIKTEFDESVYDLAAENELLQNNNIDIQFLK